MSSRLVATIGLEAALCSMANFVAKAELRHPGYAKLG
jgi:hypothetical protein